MAHFYLEQMQRLPTRLNNTLDLRLTNKPSLVKQCYSIPGISDHDIVPTDSDLKKLKMIRKLHTRFTYGPRHTGITYALRHLFSNNFIDKFNSRTVEQNYQEFSNHIKKVIIEHVPSKMTSSRSNLPWFTNSLKRMSKKNRDYTTKQRQRTTMVTG